MQRADNAIQKNLKGLWVPILSRKLALIFSFCERVGFHAILLHTTDHGDIFVFYLYSH